MERRCPICSMLLQIPKTDWVLIEVRSRGHEIACIGTAWNAAAGIEQAVQAQIAANLAAYKIDADAEINLGFRGTAWIRCPQRREIGGILIER